jgi:hypothetical protein
VLDKQVHLGAGDQPAPHGRQRHHHRQLHAQSAAELALLLRSGALPAKLNMEEQRTVGPSSAPTPSRPAISLAIGAAAMFVFIILAYGLFGVFAAIALVVNVLLIIGIMSMTQATLTFPGIAGLILTLAVAVDANVLIYERMRDEANAGRTPMSAADTATAGHGLDPGRQHHQPDLGAIMFGFGSGPVKGFAWTLVDRRVHLGVHRHHHHPSAHRLVVQGRQAEEAADRIGDPTMRLAPHSPDPAFDPLPLREVGSGRRRLLRPADRRLGRSRSSQGLNLGIDFKGGVAMEVAMPTSVPQGELRTGLGPDRRPRRPGPGLRLAQRRHGQASARPRARTPARPPSMSRPSW